MPAGRLRISISPTILQTIVYTHINDAPGSLDNYAMTNICYLFNINFPPSLNLCIWNFTPRPLMLIPEGRLINYITGDHPPLALSLFILEVRLNCSGKQKKNNITHKNLYIMKTTLTHLWTNANQLDQANRLFNANNDTVGC